MQKDDVDATEIMENMRILRLYSRNIFSQPEVLPTCILVVFIIFFVPYSYYKVAQYELLFYQAIENTSDTFHSIETTYFRFFSAYYDNRPDVKDGGPVIRILGIQTKNHVSQLFCKLHLKNGDAYCLREEAQFVYLDEESQRLRDVEVMYLCPVPKEVTPVGINLSPLSDCLGDDHIIHIKYPGTLNHIKHNMSACFIAASGGYLLPANQQALLEQIELSLLMGAQHITLYIVGGADQIKSTLDYYKRRNILTVLPWKPGDRALHRFGATLILNDCIYRNMNQYKFVVYLTLDSIVIPEVKTTWWNLVESTTNYQQIGVYFAESHNYSPVKGVKLTSNLRHNRTCNPKIQKPRIERFFPHTSEQLQKEATCPVILQPAGVKTTSFYGQTYLLPKFKKYTIPFNVAHVHNFDEESIKMNDKLPAKNKYSMLGSKLFKQLCDTWSSVKENIKS